MIWHASMIKQQIMCPASICSKLSKSDPRYSIAARRAEVDIKSNSVSLTGTHRLVPGDMTLGILQTHVNETACLR